MGHMDTMRRAYDAINAGDVDGFAGTIADDFVEHEVVPGIPPTKDGVRQFFQMYFAAFPDLKFDVEDMVQSGDTVWTRCRATGTHSGDFIGIPATGKKIDIELIDIVRFGDDGLGHEHWGVLDALKMMQQLGVVPEGPPG
jgi:steroid delta-isomerase-like uncharacterized protein